MEATIVNFRSARHHQYDNQMILSVEGYSDRAKAAELVGEAVSWKSPAGKEIKGKVASSHGNSGALRVIFETGMPGQSLGNKVEILN